MRLPAVSYGIGPTNKAVCDECGETMRSSDLDAVFTWGHQHYCHRSVLSAQVLALPLVLFMIGVALIASGLIWGT